MFAYKQYLLVYGYHPDVWYDAVSYLENASKTASDRGVGNIETHTHTSHHYIQDNNLATKFEEDARDMYSKAVAGLMKDNLLINFAFADFEEVSGEP